MRTAIVGAGVLCVAGALAASAGSATAGRCAFTAQSELATIVHRIYDQSLHGRNEASAVKRISKSTALATAVASDSPRAVRAALLPLIKNQITRINVSTANGTLARIGTVPSYGSVRGPITRHGRVVGRYVLSVAADASFVSLIHTLTNGSARFAPGAETSTRSFPATTFPSGRARVALTLPPPPSSVCAATTADTQLNAIGLVARNELKEEVHSQEAAQTLRYVEGNAAFRTAVAAGDPAALRAAIGGLFRDSHFHIVRVRAWKGTRLINDVGGPYVLSPASGVIRSSSGGMIGRFQLAIQDDTGYMTLVRLFTGVDVVLHTDTGTVPGSSLTPGPPFAAGLTTTTYRGRTYREFGLIGTMFPTGTLRVSLLQPR